MQKLIIDNYDTVLEQRLATIGIPIRQVTLFIWLLKIAHANPHQGYQFLFACEL